MKWICAIVLTLLTTHVGICQQGRTVINLCEGDTLSLTATPENEFQYHWYKGDSCILVTKKNTIDITDPGVYSVLSSNRFACSSSKAEPVIIQRNELRAIDDTLYIEAYGTNDINVLQNDKVGCVPLRPTTVNIYKKSEFGNIDIKQNGIIEYKALAADTTDKFFYTITDQDGNISNIACVIIKINDRCGVVYPNPVNGVLKVNSNNEQARQLRLCDMSGKILKVAPVNDITEKVDLSGYAKGMYILHLLNANGMTLCTFKVHKM